VLFKEINTEVIASPHSIIWKSAMQPIPWANNKCAVNDQSVIAIHSLLLDIMLGTVFQESCNIFL